MTKPIRPSAGLDPVTLAADLMARGVPPRSARALVRHYSPHGIRRQIDYYDHELQSGTRPDPEWLVDFRIKQGWRAPEGYLDHTDRRRLSRRA